jgi:hypothetical protein
VLRRALQGCRGALHANLGLGRPAKWLCQCISLRCFRARLGASSPLAVHCGWARRSLRHRLWHSLHPPPLQQPLPTGTAGRLHRSIIMRQLLLSEAGPARDKLLAALAPSTWPGAAGSTPTSIQPRHLLCSGWEYFATSQLSYSRVNSHSCDSIPSAASLSWYKFAAGGQALPVKSVRLNHPNSRSVFTYADVNDGQSSRLGQSSMMCLFGWLVTWARRDRAVEAQAPSEVKNPDKKHRESSMMCGMAQDPFGYCNDMTSSNSRVPNI